MNFFNFSKLSDIEADNPSTYENKIFLTFDVDWAHDIVLEDTLKVIEEAEVPATFFLTHETPLKNRILSNDLFELGIHPNFNFLLDGNFKNGSNIDEIVRNSLEIVPNARSVRSHSVTQSGQISDSFKKNGLTHVSNDNIPERTGIRFHPWIANNGLVVAPYCWADEHSWVSKQSSDFEDIVLRSKLAVFDFHPIHIFLNTNSNKTYNSSRNLHRDPSELIKYRFEGYGTRNRLEDLLKLKP